VLFVIKISTKCWAVFQESDWEIKVLITDGPFGKVVGVVRNENVHKMLGCFPAKSAR
jgi:hypothetical protein